MNFYAKLIIVILIVMGIAQIAPEPVNYLLILILFGMLIVQANTYSALIAQLKF